MLEKYLNKEVIIEEKLYNIQSTRKEDKWFLETLNKISGTITAIDEDFVELDNTSLISRKFIYRISMK